MGKWGTSGTWLGVVACIGCRSVNPEFGDAGSDGTTSQGTTAVGTSSSPMSSTGTTVATGSTGVAGSGDTGSTGASFGERRRVDLTIPVDVGPQAVVLVRLDPVGFDFTRTQPAGQDVRFFAADEVTVLAHEIERWDPAVGAEIWVRAPAGAAASDHMWMYYDDPSASDGQDPPSVWSDAVGVYHLNDSMSDSTAAANDAVDGGTSPLDGTIAAGRRFPPDSFIDLPPGIMDSDQGTVSLWFWSNAPQQLALSLIYIGSDNPGADGFDQNAVYVGLKDDQMAPFNTRTEIRYRSRELGMDGDHNDGVWHNVVGTWDSASTFTLYFDGVAVPAMATEVMDVSFTGTHRLGRGGPQASIPRVFQGAMDEVRLYATARSAAWAQAQFQAQQGGFTAVGMPEPR